MQASGSLYRRLGLIATYFDVAKPHRAVVELQRDGRTPALVLRQNRGGAFPATGRKGLLYLGRVELDVDDLAAIQPVLDMQTARDNAPAVPDIGAGGFRFGRRPVLIH